jgi:hypothetical protein
MDVEAERTKPLAGFVDGAVDAFVGVQFTIHISRFAIPLVRVLGILPLAPAIHDWGRCLQTPR